MVCSSDSDSVGVSVGAIVGDSVGIDGDNVGDIVGGKDGFDVGENVGLKVGDGDGCFVGVCVGLFVGAGDGENVGVGVGFLVGARAIYFIFLFCYVDTKTKLHRNYREESSKLKFNQKQNLEHLLVQSLDDL